jgi:hypothetical protein
MLLEEFKGDPLIAMCVARRAVWCAQ